MDNAHNPAAIAGLVDVVQRLDATRRIAVITAPGDRRDEDFRAVGRLFAPLDHVILKEGPFRRGRAQGEVSDRIADGLRDGGLPSDRVERVYEEPAAVTRAL